MRTHPALFALPMALLLWMTAVAHAFQITHQSGEPTLLITEIYYDTPGRDEEEEWIELANFSPDLIDLSGYKLGDEETAGGGEGMMRFPEGAQIEPGQVIVVAQTAVAFRARFGQNPDYEMNESDTAVSAMQPYSLWANGRVALANTGDEVLLLDEHDQVVDAVSFGQGATHFSGVSFGPAVPGVPRGWSIERIPAHCDSDSATDWLPQRAPTPGQISVEGECRMVMAAAEAAEADQLPPIGTIQGAGRISPFLNQVVSFRGVVTGLYESRNVSGVIYYTLFVQDAPGLEDGDPATPDGMAVFHGRIRPNAAIGDQVRVTGRIIDFYGLTEIADDGLELLIERRNQPLPQPVVLDPPADNAAMSAYYRTLEGMLVTVEGAAVVVGPTYGACGFAVVRPDSGLTHLVRQRDEDPAGQAILILHNTNIQCDGFPHVATGDRVEGLVGPLLYHFDDYKLVNQHPERLAVTASPRATIAPPPTAAVGQITLASFNVENYFDLIDDTGLEAEPKPTAAELAVQRTKLAYAIGRVMACPTLIGVQEVEKESLLIELADETAVHCGFTYQVTHLESPDLRGIDVALLSDPRRVEVVDVRLHQVCTTIETDIIDRDIRCLAGQQPLSSRPPLQVDLLIDGRPLTLFNNHFKSKRGGEWESAPQRLAQAELITNRVNELLAENNQAAVIVMGDFNDYFDSPAMQVMTSGQGVLTNALAQLPLEERYSFIFGRASQLIDGLLLSPVLLDQVAAVTILHNSADYPYSLKNDLSPDGIAYRASDHDIPMLLLQWDGNVAFQEAAAENGPTAAASSPPIWVWVMAALVGGMLLGGLGVAWGQRRGGSATLP